jgi:hypothetical protein
MQKPAETWTVAYATAFATILLVFSTARKFAVKIASKE